MNSLEEDRNLLVEKSDVLAAEDLGHEVASRSEYVRCNVQGGEDQLLLDVFVNVMHASHVGCPVRYDEVGEFTLEVVDNPVGGRLSGDVAFVLNNPGNGLHILEIDGNKKCALTL